MACWSFCSLLLALLLVSSAASQRALGSPTPVIKSASAPQTQSITNIAQDSRPPPRSPNEQGSNGALVHQEDAARSALLHKANANVADKLKRGLTNFINNLNPAPFFVPQSIGGGATKQAAAAKATSTREPPTIINDGPSADAVIKGPNRLVQARPLGGPLRWGRR